MRKTIFSAIAISLLSSTHLIANDINWTYPPTALSNISVNAENPQIAIDGSGNTVAIWLENGAIRTKTKLVNQDWGSTVSIPGTNISNPKLVMDKNGNASLIWLEATTIRTASKALNGSWSSPALLSSLGASSPALGIDSTGNIVAAWVRSGNIETAIKLIGSNWGFKNTIVASNSANPSVALGGSGMDARAIIVWEGTSQGSEVVFASTRTLLSSWTPRLILSDASKSAKNADATVDSKGNMTAIWFEYQKTGNSYYDVVLQANQKNVDGEWGLPKPISEAGMKNPSSLIAKIGCDANGNIFALWTNSFDNATYSLQSAVKPVRQDWENPVNLVSENLYSYEGDFAVSSLGDISSVYMFYNGAALQIQSSISDISGFANNLWSIPRNIYSSASNAFPKIAAVFANDNIHAATLWISNSGTTNQVFASTGSRATVLAPTNLSVSKSSQNYGVFTEYANTVSWVPSIDPTTIGYLIFRNGEWIGQVDANTTSFVDHNRVPSEVAVYGVSAYNKENSHSKIVNITSI